MVKYTRKQNRKAASFTIIKRRKDIVAKIDYRHSSAILFWKYEGFQGFFDA